MASRGRGRRGRGRRGHPRRTGQAPPVVDQPPAFDQQAFAETVGIAAAVTAQASVAGSQGGPSSAPSSHVHRGRRPDGGRPLVYAD